jgi:hypothetical protein
MALPTRRSIEQVENDLKYALSARYFPWDNKLSGVVLLSIASTELACASWAVDRYASSLAVVPVNGIQFRENLL